MPRLRRSSALLLDSALVLGALAPVTAYADDASGTTQISVDDALAAVSAAKEATDAAAEAGWTAQITYTYPDNTVENTDVAYDAADGRGLITENPRMQLIITDHGGTYDSVPSYRRITSIKRFNRALAMIGRPNATWVYEPALPTTGPSTDLTVGVASDGPTALPQLATDAAQATIVGTPTRTVAADGSTTYDLAVELFDDSTDRGTITLTVGSDDVVTADGTDFGGKQISSTYAYGPQDVPLPAAGDVVREDKVLFALRLLDMPEDVTSIAEATAKQATVGRHPHVGAVERIRRTAQHYVRMLDRLYGGKVFATRAIATGVRITGTNPFTHHRVVFTVKAVGKRAVVGRD